VGFDGEAGRGWFAARPRRSKLTRNQVQLPNALPMRGLRHYRDAEGGRGTVVRYALQRKTGGLL